MCACGVRGVCVCVWCMWMCADMCFGLALRCKSKSSDDIINTVSEPDGRSWGGGEYSCSEQVHVLVQNGISWNHKSGKA